MLNFLPYLKKSPPADTSNAEKAFEKGNVMETVDGKVKLVLRLQVSLLNAVLMAFFIIHLFS